MSLLFDSQIQEHLLQLVVIKYFSVKYVIVWFLVFIIVRLG